MAGNGPKRMLPSATLILQSIFLALVIQSALENYLNVIFHTASVRDPLNFEWLWNGLQNEINALRLAQIGIFLILLARFYFGAFRFNSETSRTDKPTLLDSLVDFLGTALLFIAFYALSKTVSTTGDFYLVILTVHSVDVLWFLAVMFLVRKDQQLLRIARWFLVWDGITIAWFLIWAFLVLETGRSDFLLQWTLLLGLLLITLVDWLVLREFYFTPEKWRGKEAA